MRIVLCLLSIVFGLRIDESPELVPFSSVDRIRSILSSSSFLSTMLVDLSCQYCLDSRLIASLGLLLLPRNLSAGAQSFLFLFLRSIRSIGTTADCRRRCCCLGLACLLSVVFGSRIFPELESCSLFRSV